MSISNLRCMRRVVCLACAACLGACGPASVVSVPSAALASTWQDAPLLAPDNEWGAYDYHQATDTQGHTLAVWEQFDGARYNI